jgi:lysyl-tRNA synthetase class 2
LGASVLLIGIVALDLRHHADYGLVLVGVAAGLALCHNGFPGMPERATVVRSTVVGGGAALLFGFGVHHHRLDWASALLLVAMVALSFLLKAAPAPGPATDVERSRVRAMVGRQGADTLAPFALRSDKSYLFSSDGSAALGYRVLLGVAVVGGDPVGEPAAFADVVGRFHALCWRRGWRPAVLGARGDLVDLWTAYGMRPVGIGDEVVLDVVPFGLGTRRMRNVRQAVRRTHNAGIRTEVMTANELSGEVRAEMAELSHRWLGTRRERGFAMILDGLVDDRHPTGLFVLAFEPAGQLVGFQRYLPCGQDTALSLDVMRRDRDRLNGLNERMIVDVVEYARANGIGQVSLNFAAFRSLLDRGDSRTRVQQAGYRLIHLLDPLIQVESLYLFNAKFRPGYVPRSVVVDSWFGLPAALFAFLGLEFALPYDRHRHATPSEVENAQSELYRTRLS